jgi:putative transposase
MPRTARSAIGGVVYHVLNRGNGRMRIFRKPGDYRAFVQLLIEGRERARVEVFGFCLMSNHWHLVLRPQRAGDLAAYLSWISNTHVKRYSAHYRKTSGHLYQGRYKSFAVEEDSYFLTLLRYVEANPLRAGMVEAAEQWAWSSLGCDEETSRKLLGEWPEDQPADWPAQVNKALSEAQLERIRTSIVRGRPLGSEPWTRRTAATMGLEYTLRPRGRPPKVKLRG